MATMTSAAAIAHMEFSATWPKLEVVSTAYQEHTSAVAMSGTSRQATVLANRLFAAEAVAYSNKAHWLAKANSATVATLRPTATSANQVSNRHRRGMS